MLEPECDPDPELDEPPLLNLRGGCWCCTIPAALASKAVPALAWRTWRGVSPGRWLGEFLRPSLGETSPARTGTLAVRSSHSVLLRASNCSGPPGPTGAAGCRGLATAGAAPLPSEATGGALGAAAAAAGSRSCSGTDCERGMGPEPCCRSGTRCATCTCWCCDSGPLWKADGAAGPCGAATANTSGCDARCPPAAAAAATGILRFCFERSSTCGAAHTARQPRPSGTCIVAARPGALPQ